MSNNTAKFRFLHICFLLICILSITRAQQKNWTYIAIDSNKQKWGDWDEPQWLRYFGLDFNDVNRDGLTDVISGRYIYLNPGGSMNYAWKRIVLDDNVDAIISLNVDDDPYADIIVQSLPEIYWYEAINQKGTHYTRKKITEVPATGHVNSQGFRRAQVIDGGKEELLIAGNGNIYCISIPENADSEDSWPARLIARNTSDEGIGVGDVDGDGDLDIVAGRRPVGEDEPLILTYFDNPGTVLQEWEDMELGESEHPIDRIEVIDLNNDNRTDIVFTEERYPGLESDASLYLYIQKEQALCFEKRILVTQYSMNNLDVADMDKDGDMDIITNEHKGPNLELQLWKNDGKANFTKTVLDKGKENHLGAKCIDIDRDGDLDIVGSAWDNYRWMHLWRNDEVLPYAEKCLYKEYSWLPENSTDTDKFLRVGGKNDYRNNDWFREKGSLSFPASIDFNNASSAQLFIERVQSHEDTKNLTLETNDLEIEIPDPLNIPSPASDYMFHVNARVNLPLETLQSGKLNFNLRVDTNQRWNWPQNLIYGMNLRVYYPVQENLAEIQLKGKLGDSGIELSLADNDEKIEKVEYIGLYEDVNYQGDGIYRQWQFYFFKTQMNGIIGSSEQKPFSVKWKTDEVVTQDFSVRILARVHLNNGYIYQTEAVQLIIPPYDEAPHLIKPYLLSPNWVTREEDNKESFYLDSDPADIIEVSLCWRSWSPCYTRGFNLNGTAIGDTTPEMPCYSYYEHAFPLQNLSALRKRENILSTNLTPLIDGHMVHGMEVQYPGIMLKIKSQDDSPGIDIYESEYEGRPHFVIATPKLTYYFDIRGGGFSRLIDKSGNDWISFKKEPWGEYPASAASTFRGLPNLVFKGENGGAGHPGFDKCISKVKSGNTLVTQSTDGKWQWEWTFFESYAELNVIQTDESTPYWFLYEGTPGGKYSPDSYYYGSNIQGPVSDLPDFYKGESSFQTIQWAYTGNKALDECFFMIHLTPAEQSGIIGFLGNTEEGLYSPDGMTVFGFGRNDKTEPLLKGKHQFIIGIYSNKIASTENHTELSHYIKELTQ